MAPALRGPFVDPLLFVHTLHIRGPRKCDDHPTKIWLGTLRPRDPRNLGSPGRLYPRLPTKQLPAQ
jgi:hypothetical protein